MDTFIVNTVNEAIYSRLTMFKGTVSPDKSFTLGFVKLKLYSVLCVLPPTVLNFVTTAPIKQLNNFC
jgi:hypothetical protein